MYDQEQVNSHILSTGQRGGTIRASFGVPSDEAAIYVSVGAVSAFYTPEEARALIEELIDRADVEGWLHEPATLHFIARMNDYADVVDNTTDAEMTAITEKWDGFNHRTYDWERDERGHRRVIQEVKER